MKVTELKLLICLNKPYPKKKEMEPSDQLRLASKYLQTTNLLHKMTSLRRVLELP